MLLKPGFIGLGNMPLSLREKIILSPAAVTSTGTTSDVDVGRGFSTRRIVYAIAGSHRNGVGPTAVSLGGVSASAALNFRYNPFGGQYNQIIQVWWANVTTGSSIDIVRTGSAGDQNFSHSLYILSGGYLDSTPTTYTGGTATAMGGLTVNNVSFPDGSFSVAGFGSTYGTSGSAGNLSWTNMDEDAESSAVISIEGLPVWHVGSTSSRTAASESTLSVTANFASNPGNSVQLAGMGIVTFT